jgi:hypothetical protein
VAVSANLLDEQHVGELVPDVPGVVSGRREVVLRPPHARVLGKHVRPLAENLKDQALDEPRRLKAATLGIGDGLNTGVGAERGVLRRHGVFAKPMDSRCRRPLVFPLRWCVVSERG